MKIGVFGDIHSNLNALTRVLSALKRHGCDRLVCLGDIVGYGPRPQECVDLIRGMRIPAVIGNHDDWIGNYLRLAGTSDYVRDMIIWTKKQLSPEAVAFIKSLPPQATVGGVGFVHSSNCIDLRYWPYVRDLPTLKENFHYQQTDVAFCGHTHRPAIGVYHEEEGSFFIEVEPIVYLQHGYKLLINPGSVGQPRDGDPRAACAIYDSDEHSVEFLRVEYDIERTQQEMVEAGLPEPYIERLALGR